MAKRGELTGPNPTDRGKLGSKYHLLVDSGSLRRTETARPDASELAMRGSELVGQLLT